MDLGQKIKDEQILLAAQQQKVQRLKKEYRLQKQSENVTQDGSSDSYEEINPMQFITQNYNDVVGYLQFTDVRSSFFDANSPLSDIALTAWGLSAKEIIFANFA